MKSFTCDALKEQRLGNNLGFVAFAAAAASAVGCYHYC